MEEKLKRPKEVVYYQAEEKKIAYIDEETDTFQLLSMIFGVIAFMLKYRFSIWLSMTFFLSNYFDQRIGISQGRYMMNFGLILLAFLLLYIIPA